MESLQLNHYLENLKNRRTTKHRNRLEELVEPHYKDWNWSDDSFFSDMAYLWVSLRGYMKNHTEHQLQELLRWGQGKNLHPKQFIKALNK